MAALDAARKAAEVLKEVSEGVGIPWLKAGVGTVLIVLNMAKKARTNAEDVRTLTQRLSELTAMIMNAPMLKDPKTLPPALQAAIVQLTKLWERIGSDATTLGERNRLRRFWSSEEDAEKIKDFIFRLTLSLQSFMTESTARIEAALHQHALNVNTRLNEVQQNIQETSARLQEDRERDETNFAEVKAGLEDLRMSDSEDVGALPYAKAARYDASNARNGCLEGTRAGVLEEIEDWIARKTADDEDSSGPSGGPELAGRPTSRADARIFWLNGIAGTGKTTIGYTVAERCHARGILAGCFFCSRDDADCSDVQKIWTTLAYHLALFSPAFRRRLVEALRRDPQIIHAHAPKQLQVLIMNILVAIPGQLVDCIIVIDALDECHNSDAISIVISMLLQYAEDLVPIRFFLTSRPEAHIRGSFDGAADFATTARFPLHKVRLEVVNPDIRRFIVSKLEELKLSRRYRLPDHWPTDEQVNQLVANTHGLFIHAFTCTLFIGDRNSSNPVRQLDILVSSNSGTSSAFTRLDNLYLQVLSLAFPDISPELSRALRMIIGAIVTLKDPLPLTDIAALLNLELIEVQNSLSNLHSVLIIPDLSSGSLSLAVRIIHPTFAEFIVDPARCTNPAFVVEPTQAHTLLLRSCLNVMLGTLKRDICDIRDPTLFNSEVSGLDARIHDSLPVYVQYACRFWVAHLVNIQVLEYPDVLGLLRKFAREKLLYWIEACSLLGILHDALLGMKAAEQRFEGSDLCTANTADLLELLHDGGRLLMQFFRPINASCLHVYFSALPMCPTGSSLRRIFTHELACAPSPRTVLGARQMWHRRLGLIAAHSHGVRAVGLSLDGAVIATGCRDDMVQLWDASSFAHIQTVGWNLHDIVHLEFSPDSGMLACLADGGLHLWTVSSGALVQTFDTGAIRSFVFIHDGMRLVTPAVDPHCSGPLRLWKVGAGESSYVGSPCPANADSQVHSLAISLDGRLLATLSSSGHLSILDTTNFASRICRIDVAGGYQHSGEYSVVFARDGKHVFVTLPPSGTGAQTIMYDVEHLSELWRVGADHLGISEATSIRLFAYPDAVRVCAYHRRDSALLDYSVSVFSLDAASRAGNFLFCFQALGDEQLEAMACSADGTRILTADQFGSIQIWDCATRAGDATLDRPPTGSISAVIEGAMFSPDGSTMLAWYQDQSGPQWWFGDDSSTGTLKAYDTATWTPHDVLAEGTVLGDGTTSSATLRRLLVPSSLDCWWWAFDYKRLVGTSESSRPGNQCRDTDSENTTISTIVSFIRLLSTCVAGYSPFRKVVLTYDGSCLVTTEDIRSSGTSGHNLESRIFVWDSSSLAYVRSLPSSPSSIDFIALSFDGTRIVSVAGETITLRDFRTGVKLWMILTRPHERHTEGSIGLYVDTVAFSPTGDRLACRHKDGVITLLDASNGVQQWATGVDHPVHPTTGYWFQQTVAFTSDGTIVISTEGPIYVSFWDAATGNMLTHFKWSTFLDTVRLTADGTGLILNPEDEDRCIVRLWASANDFQVNVPSAATQRVCLGPSAEHPVHFWDGDGWVWEMSPGRRRRLFWTPPELGIVLEYCPRRYITFVHGHVVDITEYCTYLDRLDTDT